MPAGTPLPHVQEKKGLLRSVLPDFLFIQMEIVASSFWLLQLTKKWAIWEILKKNFSGVLHLQQHIGSPSKYLPVHSQQ